MANARSGMGVHDECLHKFLDLKRKKEYRYIVFKLDEKKKEVVVDRTGGPTESYDAFATSLPSNEPRYAVFDFDFITEDNCQKSKIFFIFWSPDTSGIRTKFLYATSKDRFRGELDGIHCEIQATDASEMDVDVIKSRAF